MECSMGRRVSSSAPALSFLLNFGPAAAGIRWSVPWGGDFQAAPALPLRLDFGSVAAGIRWSVTAGVVYSTY